mgnify:CR=1 FL=1
MPRRDDLSTILVLRSGPIVIGQACEFDYSGAQACKALECATQGSEEAQNKGRKKMAVLYSESAKPAMTDYRVLERFRAHCLLQVKLHSGRTHQIRVHMAHIRHPVVGDPLYGGRLRIPSGCSEALREALRTFRRQALHAFRLGFEHPATGEWVEWEAPLPDDMERLLSVLREDVKDA